MEKPTIGNYLKHMDELRIRMHQILLDEPCSLDIRAKEIGIARQTLSAFMNENDLNRINFFKVYNWIIKQRKPIDHE